MIKMIATDLDNTALLDGMLTKENEKAIKKAIDSGIEFVVATGRGLSGIPKEVRNINKIRYAITSNGASIYDLLNEEILSRFTLSPESVKKLLKIGHKYNATYEIFVDGKAYVSEEYYENPDAFGMSKNLLGYIKSTRIPVKDIDKFIYENNDKIENFAFVVKSMDIHETVEKESRKNCPDVYITSTDPWWVEVMSINAGKGKAVLYLADYLKINTSDVATFGDGDNDVEMLEIAGLSFAVANASDKAKKAADQITSSVSEDGLACGIYEIITKNSCL